MMLHLPRREIVRQVRANLGMQTSNDLASQVDEQHIVAVNNAAFKVQQEMGWVNALKRVTVTLGIEQDHVNYPEDARPGSIRGAAVYDTDRYYPLEPRVIPVQADTDIELTGSVQLPGGPPAPVLDATAVKQILQAKSGRPRYYQERDQLYFWPRALYEYQIRLEYMQRVDMPADDTMSVVDALLIIYSATEALASATRDELIIARFRNEYQERLRALRGWQSAGTRFAIDSEADLGEDEFFNQDLIPRWDRSPTPSASNNGASGF